MARETWFDPVTNEVMFSKYMADMESWQAALADGRVDADEVAKQAQRVEALLRALEPLLNDALHEKVTRLLYELAVFYGMAQVNDLTAGAAEES
jgi:hypothetical protein